MAEARSKAPTRRVRRRRLVHLLTGVVLGMALLQVSAVSGLAADHTIQTAGSAGSYHWEPSTATVSSGGTVEFKNMDGDHGVVWESSPETPSCPGVPSTGQTSWSGTCTFNAGGTYNFHCPVHPTEMRGTITVSGGAAVPVVSTGTASSVGDNGATLNGTVNPNGVATSYYFEYGTSTAYGTKNPVTPESVGSGTVSVSRSVAVSSLSPATTYHFRIVAVYETNKTAVGADHTFTTTGPPTATTQAAGAVGGTRATLAGSVNPDGHATTYFFEYGKTSGYGSKTAEQSAGSGTAAVNVSAPVAGLSPETIYHFKLVAKSASGEVAGADRTLTTLGAPLATTGQAAGVADTAATLQGAVNPEGEPTTYYFNYGTSSAYGQRTPETAAAAGTGNVPVSSPVTGLSPGTVYHFQLVASSAAGTTPGADQTFTTGATPPPPAPPAPPLAPPALPAAPAPPPPPPPAAAPDTVISAKPPAKTRDRTPTVKFKATVGGATYRCSVDRGPFKPCRSPFTTPSLKPGRHRIRVEAVAGGATDPTPASCSFKVVGKKGHGAHRRHRR